MFSPRRLQGLFLAVTLLFAAALADSEGRPLLGRFEPAARVQGAAGAGIHQAPLDARSGLPG
jgi:hypothetical protein